MDKDLEKRLDRIEDNQRRMDNKLDVLMRAVDPRLLAVQQGEKAIQEVKDGVNGKKSGKTFADAKREDREKLREDYAGSRGSGKAEIRVEG